MSAVIALVGLVCILASFVCGIIILVAAFQDDVVQGLLSLCVPFYILYFAFARFQNDNKTIIIVIWLVGAIVGNILQIAGAGLAGG